MINFLVLCGCAGLFCELKENVLEVLSCPRTVSAGMYLTIYFSKREGEKAVKKILNS